MVAAPAAFDKVWARRGPERIRRGLWQTAVTADADRAMRIVVFQHAKVEHPGMFRNLFREDGFAWDVVELDHGEPIPDLDSYDLMVVMGGPQDVWHEPEHPWLREEKEAIRQFVVEMQRPFLGVCLGHQLLADALGGAVRIAEAPEVGVMTVELTSGGETDPLFRGMDSPMTVFQWHGAEISALPAETTVLASSPHCAVQAFRYGERAYGLQYHVEITGDTVDEWAAIPVYAAALEKALGEEALDVLREDVADRLASFGDDCRSLYRNFKRVAHPCA